MRFGRRNGRTRAALFSVVVVALAAGVPIAWNNGIGEQFFPKRWVEVGPGLFRSGQLHPRLVERVLRENEVRVIVDLTHADPVNPAQHAEALAAQRLDIEHHRFPLDGSGRGDIRHYADALEVIATAREGDVPVLVHCAAGARRAAAIVASYRVLVEGRPARDVYPELDRFGRRPVAESPLLGYLNQNLEELAELLVERGVIDRVPRPVPRFVAPEKGA